MNVPRFGQPVSRERVAAPQATREGRRGATLLAIATLTVMASAIVAPSMPRMAAAFAHAPGATLLTKLILTMPALVIALAAPVAGRAIDRFGRLRLLYASLALYGAAGAAGYWIESLPAMLASRAALGLAIAGTMTCMTALVGDYLQGERRTRFASHQSVVMSVGAVVFISASGVLADIDWRAPFLLYLAGWAWLVPAAIYLHEPARSTTPSGSPPDRGRGSDRRLVLLYAITFFAVAMFYVTPVQIPFLLRDIGEPRAALAGAAIAVGSIAAAIGSWAYPRLRRGAGFLRIYALAFALMAAGYALAGAMGSYAGAVAGVALAGLGAGLFFPHSNLLALSVASPQRRGRVSGALTAAIFMGQFFSPILVQPAVAMFGVAGAFIASSGMLLAAALALALWPEIALSPFSETPQ